MRNLREQKNLIKKLLKEDEFTLMILDACRFDFFASEYEDFIKGKLIKARSPASQTIDWLNRCLSDHYDLTVISASPFVNTKVPYGGYDGRKHFSKIVDVWDWGWDDELSTVHPQKVNEAYEFHAGKRTVVWYMQPHSPYIGKTKITLPSHSFTKRVMRKSVELRHGIIPLDGPLLPHPIRKILEGIGEELTGSSAIEKRARDGKIDIRGLREGYRENLRLVLKYASEIAERTRGKVVLSSDHGEYLGEQGRFFHIYPRINAPELREVPWLVVK